MDNVLSERDQKYSYEDYQFLLKEMAKVVKKYRDQSIKAAQRNGFLQSLIEYPIKLLLGTSLSGGGIELFGNLNNDQKWISYLRTVFELIVMILLTTKDFGQFEKKKQKFIQAQTLLSSFHNIIRQQIKIKKEFEGDREEIIKEFTESFENLKGTNVIIQEFGIHEDSSKSETPLNRSTISFAPSDRLESSRKDNMIDARSNSSDSDSTNPDDVEMEEMEAGMAKPQRPTFMQYKSIRQGKCSTALINDMLERIN